jgi:hypothetical protein
MFQLSFDTDHAAFYDEGGEIDLAAVADVIATIAGKVERGQATGKFQNVRDINGNNIGTWKLAPEENR